MLYTKINSKFLKDLNIRQDTIKLKESIGKTLSDIICANVSLDQFPKAIEKKKRNKNRNKSDLIKLASFCTERKP